LSARRDTLPEPPAVYEGMELVKQRHEMRTGSRMREKGAARASVPAYLPRAPLKRGE
jgi:hypothetical protein